MNIRNEEAYRAIMKIFEDTSVKQSVTRENLLELREEIDSLILALNDPRPRKQ